MGLGSVSNRALLLLLWLTVRAKFRRSLRGARTVRGAVFLGLGAIVLTMWMAPAVLHANIAGPVDLDRTRTFFPLLLLTMCVSNLVTTAGERAVAFSPAEVDLLFAAPFTRRQLLLYKLARSAIAAASVSVLFSILFLRYASFWLAGFVGMLLSLLLLQLLSVSVVLVGQTVGERAYTRGRRIALVAVVLILAMAAVPLLRSSSGRGSLFGVAQQLREAPAVRVLLAPFDVFARIVTAPAVYPDMLQSGALALVILGTLLGLVMWLDAHYLEVSAAAGQRVYDRVRRLRAGGGVALRTSGGARLRVPMLPRFGGAGAIAWRQLTAALRQSRSLLILLMLISLGAGPALYAAGLDLHAGSAMIGLGVWLTLMLANSLRFDFRGDVDHIDVLKSLPVRPWRLAVAQLVAPTLAMTLLQLAVFAGVQFIYRDLPAYAIVAAALLVVPFNVLLFATENLIFLLFPVRYASGPGDLQGFGRQMVVLFLKVITMTILAGIAALVGTVVAAVTTNMTAAVASACAVLWIEAAAMIPALVGAYLKFDPSTDTPA